MIELEKRAYFFGMMPSEFFNLTPRDVIVFIIGKSDRDEYDQSFYTLTWNLIRWVGTVIWNSNSKRSVQPKKVFPLPHDVRAIENAPIMSESTFKELRRKYDKIVKK